MGFFGTDPFVVEYALDVGIDTRELYSIRLVLSKQQIRPWGTLQVFDAYHTVVQTSFTGRLTQHSGSVMPLVAVLRKDVLTFAPPVL
jgi:hypothetical protein